MCWKVCLLNLWPHLTSQLGVVRWSLMLGKYCRHGNQSWQLTTLHYLKWLPVWVNGLAPPSLTIILPELSGHHTMVFRSDQGAFSYFAVVWNFTSRWTTLWASQLCWDHLISLWWFCHGNSWSILPLPPALLISRSSFQEAKTLTPNSSLSPLAYPALVSASPTYNGRMEQSNVTHGISPTAVWKSLQFHSN